MKTNELRIGNLITFENELIEVNYITTVSIGWNYSNFAPLCIKDAFKPIPLTEDWLLKFGFEKLDLKHSDDSISKDVYKNYPILIKDNLLYEDEGRYIAARFSPGEINKVNFITHIDYIHQLQNLYFALTQKQLTIKEHENKNK